MIRKIDRIKVPVFEEQRRNVTEAMDNNYLVYGPHLKAFENELIKYFNKKFVILTSNGFSALFLALKAVAPDFQRVLTAPCSSCFAFVNAIRAAGHHVAYTDIEMSSASLPALPEQTSDLVAVIPDHFGLIASACRYWKEGIGVLIEDASQSFFSRLMTPTEADIVVLSFYPSKLINGIDGGALMTDDYRIYERSKQLLYYSDQSQFEIEPRYNLKMNNINAAFALGTLHHLNDIENKLMALYDLFSKTLDAKGIQYLKTTSSEIASRFVIIAEDESWKKNWMNKLHQDNIEACMELGYVCPPDMICDFKETRKLVENSFSVPFHPLLSDQDVECMKESMRRL